LHVAAAAGNAVAVEALLEAGASPSGSGAAELAPLMVAALCCACGPPPPPPELPHSPSGPAPPPAPPPRDAGPAARVEVLRLLLEAGAGPEGGCDATESETPLLLLLATRAPAAAVAALLASAADRAAPCFDGAPAEEGVRS